MGGAIIVGVRLSNNTSILTQRWTNCTSWELADPDFFDENSQVFKDWLNRAIDNKSKDKFGYDKVINKLKNIEYGIILIDLKQLAIWSENHYCDVAGFYCGPNSTAFKDELKIVCKLEKRGWLKDIKPILKSEQELNRIEYLEAAITENYDYFDKNGLTVRIEINRPGFEYSHQLNKRGIIARAKKWALPRGWKNL